MSARKSKKINLCELFKIPPWFWGFRLVKGQIVVPACSPPEDRFLMRLGRLHEEAHRELGHQKCPEVLEGVWQEVEAWKLAISGLPEQEQARAIEMAEKCIGTYNFHAEVTYGVWVDRTAIHQALEEARAIRKRLR